MTIYLVNFAGCDDAWVEAGFTKEADAKALADEMCKGETLGSFEVNAYELDARVGEKRVCEWSCIINVAAGDTPEQRRGRPPLVSVRNVKADEASEYESGEKDGYLYSHSIRSPEHAKELLLAEYEIWKQLPLAEVCAEPEFRTPGE